MAIYSFTQIEAARIPITSQLNSTRAGCRILFRDSLASSTPISKISMDTARPERYSARPWPKGWPGSGALAAMRKQRDHRGTGIREVVEGVRRDGDGAGEGPGKELAQKQQQVQPDPNSAAENTVGRP